MGTRIPLRKVTHSKSNSLRKNPQTGHCERGEAIWLLKISINYQIASSSREARPA
jgi:hypothetical protein